MSNFDAMELHQLQRVYSALDHKRENLQKDIGAIAGYKDIYAILPKHYNTIPELRNVPDGLLAELESVHRECFDAYWTMKRKEAEENDSLELYWAEKKIYSFKDKITDDEFFEFMMQASSMTRKFLTTHSLIRLLVEYPNFIDEVIADEF